MWNVLEERYQFLSRKLERTINEFPNSEISERQWRQEIDILKGEMTSIMFAKIAYLSSMINHEK